MIPFQKQPFSHLLEIALEMKSAGLSEDFIEQAVRLAMDLEGIRDLMIIWETQKDESSKSDAIADLQDEIDEYLSGQKSRIEKPFIKEDQFDSIAKSIRQFKKKIRESVDDWGGVSKLAKATGIPQPSLSRFFNTSAMPRRETLLKIAKAVGLKEKDIAFEWMR